MEATTIAPISFPTAMNCSPWVDYVEAHKGESAVGVVMFVNCLLTILANIILFIVIFSNKESREQRCNMFMVSIGFSDVLYALDLLIFTQPGLSEGRFIDSINKSVYACQGIHILGTFLIAATWYNFLGLNIDRLYAIKRPFHFHADRSSSAWARRSVSACWLAALVPTVPLWFDKTIEEDWAFGEDCKCFFPISNTIYLGWASLTMFVLPTCFILLIWGAMAHHFVTQPVSMSSSNTMKWVTIKMVGITSLFLVTIAPFCIAFTHALVVTPKSTFLFDVTFPLSLFNGPLQPVIYILAFSKLRRAFWELFCPLAKNRSLNTAVDAPVRVTMVTMEMKPSCSLIDIRKMASINNWSRGIE